MTQKIIRSHCNNCGHETRHEVRHNEETRWVDDDHEYSITGGADYDLLKCCGCENVCLRHQTWMSEDVGVRGDLNIKTVFYPPASFRQEPKWISELLWEMPKQQVFLGELIQEIYIALRNGSPRLAVMGIRALLEQVMLDSVGDQGSFKGNMNAFEQGGFISRSQRAVLDPVIEAGHATMHRAFNPTMKDVGYIMDAAESIVESVYINKLRALEISKSVPKRANTKSKPAAKTKAVAQPKPPKQPKADDDTL